VDALKEYPFSIAVIGYAGFFLIFVSILFCFHNVLILTSKTTQEKLKKDKGIVTGKLRANPYMYPTAWKNIGRTLCCRKLKAKSKITWELYNYSFGLKEELIEYYKAKDKENIGKNPEIDGSYRKIYEMEPSVEILRMSTKKSLRSNEKSGYIDDNDMDFADLN